MTKKDYPPWHYFLAAGMALLLGAMYTFSTFHLILGPGLLLVGAVFLVIGIRKQRAKAALPPAAG